MKTTQLALISTNPTDWTLDEETIRVGRNGLAQARKVLQSHHATTISDETLYSIAA